MGKILIDVTYVHNDGRTRAFLSLRESSRVLVVERLSTARADGLDVLALITQNFTLLHSGNLDHITLQISIPECESGSSAQEEAL
jgi:hypothetical protein